MKLTKKQIQRIKTAHRQASMAEFKLQYAIENLAAVIVEITNVDGNIDLLPGDGFGFTPLSNNDTHILIGDLVGLAENGIDITESKILDNLTFNGGNIL